MLSARLIRSLITQRRIAYSVIAMVSVLPRLAVIAHERSDLFIHAEVVDKNVAFAKTFVASGTFGYARDVPSADTQPLYGFFLVPIFRFFGESWLAVGLAQIIISAATALLVYEIGRRVVEPAWAPLPALIVALHPYLVWHDVHVAREVLDGLLAALITLIALVAFDRGSAWFAAALGMAMGLAVLSNVRLALLPIAIGAYAALCASSGKSRLVAAFAVIIGTLVVVTPWVARNRAQIGCVTLTTNAQALWKANNLDTYDTLAAGGWIDDVPPLDPPESTWMRRHGRIVPDECAQMRFYERRVLAFWHDHPIEKIRLAGQASWMLWDPRARTYTVRLESGEEVRPVRGSVALARTWGAGVFMTVIYVLALVGARTVPRRFVHLALMLLGYQTLAAIVFAGTTRYRAPWDFILALLAAAGAKKVARSFIPVACSAPDTSRSDVQGASSHHTGGVPCVSRELRA